MLVVDVEHGETNRSCHECIIKFIRGKHAKCKTRLRTHQAVQQRIANHKGNAYCMQQEAVPLRQIRQADTKVTSKSTCNLAHDKDKQGALRMFCRISA